MDKSDLPLVWLELKNKTKTIAIINAYREFRQVGIDRPEDNEKTCPRVPPFSNVKVPSIIIFTPIYT